jgi:hypothetical protein
MLATNILHRRYQLDTPRGGSDGVELFLAIDLVTREQVDVAIAPYQSPGGQRLFREQQFLKGIRHPSIVQVYDAGRTLDGTQFIVHEHLNGSNLHDLVAKSGPLKTDRLVGLIDQMASAIDAAHSHGILHGAVCPEHVVVYVDQLGIERCKLAGFAFAMRTEDTLRVAPAHPSEHPAQPFMSPEQSQRRPMTKGSDVYGLAATAFYAWTGKPPYENGFTDSPPRLSERARSLSLTAEVDAVMAAALSSLPATRQPSAMAFADAIRTGLAKQAGGVAGLVAAAQGETAPKRIGLRSSVATAVIRPTGARVQPAATGSAAFTAGAEPTEAPIPTAPKEVTSAEVRLVTMSAVLAAVLLWLSFSFS